MFLYLVVANTLAGLFFVLLFLWSNRTNYFGKENRQKYFAEMYKDFPEFHNEKTRDMKKKLFEVLHNLHSSIPEMARKRGIRILEIGAGTGSNFEFYPVNTRLIMVDPNPYFQELLIENLEKFSNVQLERCVVTGAENMKDVPDHSVDVVVSTLVLCSIPISLLSQVYNEIRRVLVPGGKFLYMEHVVDDKLSLLKVLQVVAGFTGLWQFLYDGCRPDLNVEAELRKSGFASVDCERFRLDLSSGVPNKLWTVSMVEPHQYGVATTSKSS